MHGLRIPSLALLALALGGCPQDDIGDDSSAQPTTEGSGSTTEPMPSTMPPMTSPATTTATDTGDATTTAGTADDDATEGSFLEMDMGEVGGTCDVYTQDCPDGEKCMPWAADGGQSWNGTTCSPIVATPGQVGDPCTVEGSAVSGLDDCDEGAMCYNVSVEDNMGTCFELCGGSPDAPTCDEGLCAIYNDGNLPLCLLDCDPLLQDCGPEQLCLASPNANGFVCILDSLPFSDGGYGAPCEYVNTCDPGFFCAVAEVVAGCLNAGGCCAEFCDLSVPDPSSQCTGQGNGEECQPWYGVGEPPPGYEDVGFCGIPS